MNMKKLGKHKIHYIYSGPATIAMIRGCEDDFWKRVNWRGASTVGEEICVMKDEIKGVAYCHDGDTYDIQYGTKLARERLQIAYNKELDRCWRLYFNTFKKLLLSSFKSTHLLGDIIDEEE